MNASLLVSVLGVDISKVIAGFEGPKYNPSVHTLHFFIERNNVKGIEWLRKLGVGDPWDEWACIKAAENGLDNQGDPQLQSTCLRPKGTCARARTLNNQGDLRTQRRSTSIGPKGSRSRARTLDN